MKMEVMVEPEAVDTMAVVEQNQIVLKMMTKVELVDHHIFQDIGNIVVGLLVIQFYDIYNLLNIYME